MVSRELTIPRSEAECGTGNAGRCGAAGRAGKTKSAVIGGPQTFLRATKQKDLGSDNANSLSCTPRSQI